MSQSPQLNFVYLILFFDAQLWDNRDNGDTGCAILF